MYIVGDFPSLTSQLVKNLFWTYMLIHCKKNLLAKQLVRTFAKDTHTDRHPITLIYELVSV